MNTPRTFVLALLSTCVAGAQENSAPASAAAPAQSEMQKWIATTDEQWQAAYKRDVTDVHEAELNKVKLQFLTLLEAGIVKASGAGDLDGTVALRNEQKRFGDTNVFPEQDEATDAASVKQLRAASRTLLAQAEKNSAMRAKALHAKYDQVLAQAQTQLTQRQRIDEALLVKAKREEVAAAWLAGANAVAANIGTPKPPVVDPVKPIAPVENEKTSLTKQLSNTEWRVTSDGRTFTLHPDGTTTSDWHQRKGSWKVTGAHTLDLSVTKAHTIQKAKLNPEHTEIKMPSPEKGAAPSTWTLIKN